MPGNDGSRMVIQPRDEHLLRELAVMRIIDREQAKAIAGFGSTTRANARLLALYREGLLRRFFQGTTAGGRKALYTLSPKGARVVGASHRGFRHQNDELIATNFFVAHQLAVNDIYCQAKCGSVPVPEAKFVRWICFSGPVAPGIPLIPDGYFEISVPQGVLAAFLEADLGHEGLGVWKAKVRHYLRYAASGGFEERFQQSRFRVLVVANAESRMQAIRRVMRSMTDKIFWFSTFEAIRRDGLWGLVWLRPAEEMLKPLF